MGRLINNFNKINQKQLSIDEIINIILYMTILVMPLIVTKKIVPQFLMGKIAFLYIVTVILILFYIINRKFAFRKEHLVAIVFLISIFVSVIFSPFKKVALYGTMERYEGAITIAIYVILFIISSQYFTVSKKSLDIILIVGSIMGAYGVLQFFGIDPIHMWMFNGTSGNIAYGTIGNRNFFSSYLIMFLIMSSSLYTLRGNKKFLVFSLIIFSGELCTLTRSGWVSILIVSILGILIIIKRKDYIKRIMILGVTFVLIIGCIDISSKGQILGRVNQTKNEISNKKDEKIIASISERSNITRVCFDIFVDNPFLGTGPDTLDYRIAKYYDNELKNHISLYNTRIDKAHNEYLEYATSCGIFTLISYLVLLVMIIHGLIKNIKDDKNKIILLTILGYMIQAFFNISVIGVAPLFWILLGYAVKVIYENNDLKGKYVKKSNKS